MATNMKAAFTLTLEDKLSSGLNAIKESLDRLKTVGGGLTLGKLQAGGDVLRTIGREAMNLTSNINGIEAAAGRAALRMKQMIMPKMQAMKEWGGKTFGPQSKVGAFAAAAEGYSLYKPLESAAELSNILRHSAITAHQYGPAADSMMERQRLLYTQTAMRTAQPSHEITEAGFWMALTGMDAKLVDKLVPMSAKIATAYNAKVGDAGKTAFGLNYSMGIGSDDMERAMGMLALLGKHGHFLFADQAKEMPGVAAAAQNSHMTGMGSLEQIGAALQISMKVVDPSQPAMASTNLISFLSQIQRARDDKTFSRYGADLPAILMDAAKHGISPMEATLAEIKKIQDREAKNHHITDPAQRAQSDTAIMNHLFVQQEAGRFAAAMLHNMDEYMHLKTLAHDTSSDMITQDFQEAMRDLSSNLNLLKEGVTQVVDRLGRGFSPVLSVANFGLGKLVTGMEELDKKFPGVADAALAVTGGMLALGAALATIGFVAPAVAAGGSLVAGAAAGIGLLNPFTLVTALPAYLGYKAWGERHEGENVDPNTQVPYFDPNGIPAVSSFDTAQPHQPGELHVRISSDPGTKAEVTHASPGIFFTIPNPGRVTGQP